MLEMATKDITDRQVLLAYAECDWRRGSTLGANPIELLMRMTGQPEKVCWRACERAFKRDLLDYGVSLKCAWLTEKGRQCLT